MSSDQAPAQTEEPWEYGFYDSHPAGNWRDEPEPQTDPLIFWGVFGMPHKTAESARHTGEKNVWGQAVIVRRHPGETEWERVEEENHE